MTTPAVSPLLLDDATLDAGLALVSAGSGLPRRIRPQGRVAEVLAMGPGAFWRFNGAGPSFADGSPNANHMVWDSRSYAYAAVSDVPDYLPSDAAAIKGGYNTIYSVFQASSEVPDSQLVVGRGFTVAWLIRMRLGGFTRIGSQYVGNPGVSLGWYVYGSVVSGGGSVVVYASGGARGGSYNNTVSKIPALDHGGAANEWRYIVLTVDCNRYSAGAAFNGIQQAFIDGVPCGIYPTMVGDNGWSGWSDGESVTPGNGIGIGYYTTQPFYGIRAYEDLAEVAIFPRILTDDEVWRLSKGGLAEVARATWAIPSSSDARTVRRVWPVGANLREHDAAGESRSSRLYLQIGSDPEVEIEPGEDEGVTLPAGSTATVSVALTPLAARKLPFLGDSLGTEGAVAVIDEPDPPSYFAAMPAEVPAVGIIAPSIPKVSAAMPATVPFVGIIQPTIVLRGG